MPKVVAGLLDDYEAADRVRTDLVASGFPTDRVELTARREPGQAGVGPAESLPQQLTDYFANLFYGEGGDDLARSFCEAVTHGRPTITVHPRGAMEIAQAREILERHGATRIVEWGEDRGAHEWIPATGVDTRGPIPEGPREERAPGRRD